MSGPTYPLKLEPRYLEKPWGGDRIARVFGRPVDPARKIGESWELYDRPDGASRIANGELAGKTLAELRGPRELPLLTKLIDARETLSVQVHPDEEAALELKGEAKSEAWYVIESEPGALIYKGLREGVDAPALLRAVEEDRVAECLHSFHPEPGDVVFLPAGTVHAIGGGILLFEVQQNSDTTYRLFDWGRPRELHVRQAIRSADFSGPGIDRVPRRLVHEDGRYRREIRVSCPQFVMEEQEFMGIVTYETERRRAESWQAVFVLGGEGTIRPFSRGVEEVFFAAGDTLVLPAEHEHYELAPRPGRTVRLLSVHVP